VTTNSTRIVSSRGSDKEMETVIVHFAANVFNVKEGVAKSFSLFLMTNLKGTITFTCHYTISKGYIIHCRIDNLHYDIDPQHLWKWKQKKRLHRENREQ